MKVAIVLNNGGQTHKEFKDSNRGTMKVAIRITQQLRLQLIYMIIGSQGTGTLIPSQV